MKDNHDTGEASRPQKRTSGTSKKYISSLFFLSLWTTILPPGSVSRPSRPKSRQWYFYTQKYRYSFSHRYVVVQICNILKGKLFGFFGIMLFMFVIQHFLNCRPLDSTLSEDAGSNPGLLRLCH
jgi:hypothetical protein